MEYGKMKNITDLFKKLYKSKVDDTLLMNLKTNRQGYDEIKHNICFHGDKEEGIKVRRHIYNTSSKIFQKLDYGDIKLWTSQNLYLLTQNCLEKIVNNYKGRFKTYIKDQYKCGHFSVDFLDYISDIAYHQNTKASTCIGILAFFYSINGKSYGHAVNWALTLKDDKPELLVIEPQTSQIFGFNDYFEYKKSNYNYKNIQLELFLML